MNDREKLEAEFPVVLSIPVAWGDMDAMGHVNNTVYFRYFESARIAYFQRVGFLEEMKESGVGPILASARCRFRIPLTYPDRVLAGASVQDVQEDRFLMLYRIVSEGAGALAAEGDGLIVSYDYRRKRKSPLPAPVRKRIEELEGKRQR
ncbi:MAG: acyl-CoA thioesterase [Vicinamibacteria bacterium]